MAVPVSVVLPFYQAESTLERAIESILNQTFQDFELILVDNHSTDKSLKIAQKLAEKDNRIRLLREEKQGVVFAMNKGMKAAKGTFIARMDADDFSYPQRLGKQYHFLSEHPEIGVVGSNVRHVSSFPSKGLNRFVKWVNSFHSTEEIRKNRFIEIPMVQPSVMFRAELISHYGEYRQGDFPEDYELFLRWLDAGVKFYQLPETLLDWYDSASRLTRTDDRYSSEAFYKTKAFYFAKWFQRSQFEKSLWIWGAGRKSRQRTRFIENEGLRIAGFYDLHANKTSKKNCLSFQEIPSPGVQFIVSMVGNYGAREKIRSFLENKGYIKEKDFLLMA